MRRWPTSAMLTGAWASRDACVGKRALMRPSCSSLISGRVLTTFRSFRTGPSKMFVGVETAPPLAVSSTYASSLQTFLRTISEETMSPFSVTLM